MRIRNWFGAVLLATILASTAVAAPAPSPDTVAKLIAQLSGDDTREREQASDKLVELGGPALPALRKAITPNTEVELKRRLEGVVTRIETALVKSEEKNWQDLDAPRRSLKDRLVKIVARTPDLNNQQRTSAIYLLTVGRPPTDEEVKQAEKQFVETNGRAASVLSVARTLVQGKEFRAEVAGANLRLTKVKTDLAAETDLAKKLHQLNSEEFQKMTSELAAALGKVVKDDERLIELAFLLTFSRFPKANEMEMGVAHLKKTGRQAGTENILWALLNTKEFYLPE